ncbi:MAG TPA: hypothetical protein VHP14_05275 [Anaerolineales bacterium]|nr:hypothetical protein [Anaerolineales bacterium]
MESNAAIGLLIIILLIVGANFIMYVFVRSWAKGDSRWLSSLKDSLRKPMNTPTDKSMDELRKRVEELKKQKKDG